VPLLIEPREDLIGGHAADRTRGVRPIRIGLINNMPDAALHATEAQFTTLLEAAAADDCISLRLFYLPEVPRALEVRERLERDYWPIDSLYDEPLEALIVTGAEPRALMMSQEPYWARFCSIVDWAEDHTSTSIWSCLAAHAAVEHLDGVRRLRLASKCCGVFEHSVTPHALTDGLESPLLTPQSRWNELRADALSDAGYLLLSVSNDAGVNIFVRHRRSLMVFLQGHPEYDSASLLKEYRRDVHRFLEGQSDHYPSMPRNYFGGGARQQLEAFREHVLGNGKACPQAFPFLPKNLMPGHTWRHGAVRFYSNWLRTMGTS
jgi:homoserine O-succinyltransferase/O-acetyltransferase